MNFGNDTHVLYRVIGFHNYEEGSFAASSALPPEGLPATDMAAANKSYKRDFNDCITPIRQ